MICPPPKINRSNLDHITQLGLPLIDLTWREGKPEGITRFQGSCAICLPSLFYYLHSAPVFSHIHCCHLIHYLQSAIQRSLDCYTFCWVCSAGGDGCNKTVQFITLLFQFFHQALDGPLGKGLALATLTMAHQAVNNAEARIRRGWCLGWHVAAAAAAAAAAICVLELRVCSRSRVEKNPADLSTSYVLAVPMQAS